MTPGTLLEQVGRRLHGEHYKAPLAAELNVRSDTVDAWSKDRSRVPPGVWRDLFRLLDQERARLVDLMAATCRAELAADAAPQTPKGPPDR